MQDFASAGMPELRSVIPRSFAAYVFATKVVSAGKPANAF
jgi:hypothetical protein